MRLLPMGERAILMEVQRLAQVLALRERLAREAGRTRAVPRSEELATIRRRCADLPVLDSRAGDVVIGYDRHGLPS